MNALRLNELRERLAAWIYVNLRKEQGCLIDIRLPSLRAIRRMEINRYQRMAAPRSILRESSEVTKAFWGDWELALYRFPTGA